MKNIKFELFKWGRSGSIFIKLGFACVWANEADVAAAGGGFKYMAFDDDMALPDSEIVNCLSVNFITDIYKACYGDEL